MDEKNDFEQNRKDALKNKLLSLVDEYSELLNKLHVANKGKQKLIEEIKIHQLKVERDVTNEVLPSEEGKTPKKAFPNDTLRSAEVARRLHNDQFFQEKKKVLEGVEDDYSVASDMILVNRASRRAYSDVVKIEFGGEYHGQARKSSWMALDRKWGAGCIIGDTWSHHP